MRAYRGLLQPTFTLLWLSETAMSFGSALMNFALSTWIFQQTGSAERFSYAILAAAVPALLLTPVAGNLADRFDRRWVIVSCDMAMAAVIAALAWLWFHNMLAPWHLYLLNAASASISSLRVPAYSTVVSIIVPKDRLTQASGLTGMSQAMLDIFAPLIAGYIVGSHGLGGVIGVDILMILCGGIAVFMSMLRATQAIRRALASAQHANEHTALSTFRAAARYFKGFPALIGLASYGMLQQSLLLLSSVMLTPLVLSTQSSKALGIVLMCGALGGLAGSLLLLVARPSEGLMQRALLADAALSAFVAMGGLSRTVELWSICAFFAFFAGGVSSACTSALWARKTPPQIRGSIFAMNASLNLSAMCVVVLVGGFLSEHIFEPSLDIGGAWSSSVGAWIGVGKGRGIGFLLIVCGAVSFASSLFALLCTRLRHLDALVPDHTQESFPESLQVGAAVT
jgi:diaminobutyrate-2-oxoglutarate transaminase